MLKKLKDRIKKHGVVFVCDNLGYRSTATILKWIKEKKIPECRKKKVKEFLDVY